MLRIFFGDNTQELEPSKPRSLALLPGVIKSVFCLDGVDLFVKE